MHGEGTTRKKDKAKDTGFGCDPGDFQKMSGEMGACGCSHEGFPDCRAMMKRMMEAVKNQPCCKPAAEKTE